MQFDIKFQLADILPLLAALENRPACAARLLRNADAGYAAYGLVRQLSEGRIADRADQVVRPLLGAPEFECLRTRDATLQDDAILPLALATATCA